MGKLKTQQRTNFGLADVARLMRRDFNRRVSSLGLTEAQWLILVRLSTMEGARQTQLADILEMHPISIARLIDRLVASGWVERRADPSDRRAVNIFLTEKVEPIIDEMWDKVVETRRMAWAGISKEDQDRFLEVLDKMRLNLIANESAKS